MKKDSQNQKILTHIVRNKKGITPITALNRYGCFRLASRIHDLRAKGFIIKTGMENKNGKTYARYFLG